MDIFNKKAKESEQTTGKLDDVFRALSPSAITAVAGITALVASVKSLSQASLANYAHFEKLEMGLTTFFQSADKGKAKFEELRKLSNETTFGVDELTDSFTQLANVGVNTDTIKDKLTMLGDLAQGDKAKFAELTSIYAKINSTGKAGAMQLQQIASRGIPIYDMLKKIGVQGTATANDITKAFEKMTEEGGQFHDAMNNINQTIEGKQGFISDYLKEMSVNFAEVTGLADAYKDVLDVLKDVIGAISDKLLEWSKDPVMKAIISGLFVGAIASIATALLTSLIPTLATVIAKLTTIRLLEGAKGWAVLAVAGISVAVGAYASYSRSLKQATEDNEKLRKAVEDTKKAMGNNYGLLNVGVNTTNTAVKSRDSAKNSLEGYKKNLEEFQSNLEKAQEKLAKAKQNAGTDIGIGEILNPDLYFAEEADEVKRWQEAVDITTNSIERQTKTLKFWEDEVNRLNVDELAKQFEAIYESTLPKEQAEIESLKTQLNTVLEYKNKLKSLDGQKDANGNIISYEKSKSEIDKTVDYLQTKLNAVTLDLNFNNLEEWQKDLAKQLGFDKKTAVSLQGKSGDKWIEKYQEIQKDLNTRREVTERALGINKAVDEKSRIGEKASSLSKLAQDLLTNSSQKFGMKANGELDNTFKALQGELNNLKTSFVKAGGTVDEWDAIMGNSKEVIQEDVITSLSDLSAKLMDYAKNTGSVGAYAGSKAISMVSGTAIGQAAEGAMEGASVAGPWGALIGAILGLLSSMEHWQDFLDELDDLVEPLKPILNSIIGLLVSVCKVLEAFAEPIQDLLSWIMQIVNLVSVLFRGLAKIISVINNVFSWLLEPIKALASGIENVVDWLANLFGLENDIKQQEEDELARKKALNDAYSNMLSTLRDVQEEYEKRKKAINAQGYADSVTGVHDMILTPQGRFSTDPDDYIIATKNPSGLNNGGKGDIIINNYSNAQVEAKQDDMGNTVILISQKVAMDYANGNNGWDSAVMTRQARTAGRQLSM